MHPVQDNSKTQIEQEWGESMDTSASDHRLILQAFPTPEILSDIMIFSVLVLVLFAGFLSRTRSGARHFTVS
jgi:hypothetical protein